jgi:hypothetical protein
MTSSGGMSQPRGLPAASVKKKWVQREWMPCAALSIQTWNSSQPLYD